mgnify:CR=1 FL=1
MRKKSLSTHHRALELEDDNKDLDSEESRRNTKPLKSMVEDREKRRIGSFYPMDDDDVFSGNPKEEETLNALGFTRAEETPRDRYGNKSTFGAADIEFGGDVQSGMTFGGTKKTSSSDFEFESSLRDSREYNNRSPEDSGFGDEKLERLGSPKSRDEETKWSFDIKEEESPVRVKQEVKVEASPPPPPPSEVKEEVIMPKVNKKEESAVTLNFGSESSKPPFTVKKISRVAGPREFLGSKPKDDKVG